jgi:hypothetical protein
MLLKPTALALAMAALFATAAPAGAAEMNLRIEVPTLNVAEYHRPYLAAWIERADQSVAANLAVWYDVKKKDKEGEKWLKDMRQWWRRTGASSRCRSTASAVPPAPRVSRSSISVPQGPLANRPPDYVLMVEAARSRRPRTGQGAVPVAAQVGPERQGPGSRTGAVALELKP